MRPLRLELMGFGAFREPVEIDFTDVDFFALVGDTGAGKSTVLDAICFALYGNVPRYDDQRLVGAAMSLGANEARVRFTFGVGGRSYVVARVVRRGAQNKVSTKEARLERADDGEVLAGRESELRAAVEELVGLGFDDFTRCVVLPQGAFARFLHDKPADRQALLVRLLELGVYGRLVNRANARANERQRELDHLTGQLSELPAADAAARSALQHRLVALDRLGALLDDAEPRSIELQRVLDAADAAASAAAATAAALAAIDVPTELVEQAERRAAAAAAVERAESDAAAAQDLLDRLETAAATRPEPARLEHALAVHERISKGTGVVEARAAEVAACRAECDALAGAAHEAELALRAAEAAYAGAESAHRAHAIAVTLAPGEPCPVCEQVVAVLPFPSAPPALERALAGLESARTAHREAERSLAGARTAVERAEASWRAAAERLDELRVEVAAWPDADALAELVVEVRAEVAALTEARSAARRSSQKVLESRRALAALEAAVRDLGEGYHLQRDRVAALGPPSPGADLAESWAALASWAAARRPGMAEEVERNRAVGDSARLELRDLLASLTDAVVAAEVPVPSSPSPASLRGAVERAADSVRRGLDELERAARRRHELEAATERVAAERAVAHELARHLKTDRFQRWLVESTFHELAERASDTLRQLSNGQFSLRVQPSTGEFTVVDHLAADEERSVRTLSGGETFQASLALALALSDHVMELAGAGGRHRLESIFLDEGFGTLDPSTLETVAATIEGLGSDGRMVGIVTHVADLADRVPVRFRVTKGPRTSVVTREG